MSSLKQDLQALPRDVWVISIGLFFNKFGNFVTVFVVLYLTTKGYSPAAAGAALAVIGLGNFVGNALGGILADVYGRRKTVIVSMLGAGIITMSVPLVSSSFVAIVALLGVLGVFAQLCRPAASAMVVDSVRPDQLLTAFALIRLAINVGMAVGPAVGGLLSSYSYTWIFVGDGLTCIVYGLMAVVFLKPDAARERETSQDAGSESTAGYGVVLRDRRYLAYLLSMVAATYVYIQATATLPLHVRAHGLSNGQFGLLLGLNALLVVALELPITKLTGRYPSRPVISVGLMILGIGMAATGVSGAMLAIAVTVVLWSAAEMVYTPVANAYPGEVAPVAAVGRYQGAEGLAHTLGATLGPAVGGALYAYSPNINWLVCLVVACAGAGLILLAQPEPRQQPVQTPSELTEEVLQMTVLEEHNELVVSAEQVHL